MREDLDEARRKLADGDYAGALAACARAREAGGPPELRALEVWLRACADVDREPDVAELSAAAETLVRASAWEDAMGAWGMLGRLGKDRRAYSRAIACAEQAGSAVGLAGLRLKLGRLELGAGRADLALAQSERARQDVAGLLGMTVGWVLFEEAELRGDAHAALGDRAQAEQGWREAIALQERYERKAAADRIRKKLER